MKKKKSREPQKNINKLLSRYSELTKEELFRDLHTTDNGISMVDIEDELEEHGKNIIDVKNTNTPLKRFRESFINPFNVILIVIAVITFITDVIIVAPEEKSYAAFILILCTIIASTLISFFQQTRSDQAVKKLQNMISNKVDVIRDSHQMQIDISEVVPGDIVKLAAGDMLPGDVRFIEAKDLFINQAPLTGESNPVEKFSEYKETKEVTDLANIGFMGTNVTSGKATAVVLTTGSNTYFGNMAKSLYSINPTNSFERGVNDISKLLIISMLVMVPIILIINLVTKNSALEAVIFAVTIAVALTPEMLPVIITSTLARGAVNMSKKRTIVKRLGSIQTFGEMNILCTDKTGTLTEDKVVLEKYMDAYGNENPRILKHAFLNSYFETGLKNLLDEAIIARAEKEKLGDLKDDYVIEDEVPFDFTRRRLSVVLRDDNGKRQLITKGAAEEIISICSYVDVNGDAVPFSDEEKEKVYKVYEKYNDDGLRVLAVAQKNDINDVNEFGVEAEKDMVLMGFVGFLDPPKKSSKEAISKLKKYGVDTVVLTGDSEGVALNVCEQVGIKVNNHMTGTQIDELTDEELKEKIKTCHLYSKLSPLQKQRIVKLYQENGNTVGFLGDGINDSPPLKQADVGISVDTAVDIAKETADIILLENDLNILEEGVITGRKTFANVLKYVKMATSGNFGNIVSLVIASIFLPFLPMLPAHILIQNLLNDFAQTGMAFDNVDVDNIKQPKKWDTKSIRKFMIVFGLISSVVDILCFLVLWFVMKFNTVEQALYFQTGWFVYGTISQTLIIHMIRTEKIPLVQSKPSKQLIASTFTIALIALVIAFTGVSAIFNLVRLPIAYIGALVILLVIYAVFIQVYKKIYIKRNKEWI